MSRVGLFNHSGYAETNFDAATHASTDLANFLKSNALYKYCHIINAASPGLVL